MKILAIGLLVLFFITMVPPAFAQIVSSSTTTTQSSTTTQPCVDVLCSNSTQRATQVNPGEFGFQGIDKGKLSWITSATTFLWNVTAADYMKLNLPKVGPNALSNTLVYYNSTVTAWQLSTGGNVVNIYFKPSQYSAKISIDASLGSPQSVCLPFIAASIIIQQKSDNGTLLPSVKSGNEVFDWSDIPSLYLPTWGASSLCVSLPAGTTHIDPLALDSSGVTSTGNTGCRNTVGTTKCSITITLASANDVIIVDSSAKSTIHVASISSSPSITFNHRLSVVWIGQINDENTSEWYSSWTSSGAINITITYSGARVFPLNVVAFGVSGANIAAPFFDTNAGVPASATGSGVNSTSTVNVSTTESHDMLIGVQGADSLGVGATCNAGAGYTKITGTPGGAGAICTEYQIVSAPKTAFAVAFGVINSGSADSWGIVADAIQLKVVNTYQATPSAKTTWDAGLTSGAVWYWPLDTDTGTTTADYSGVGATGTLACNGVGCTNPTWTSAHCKFGFCLTFPATATTSGKVTAADPQGAISAFTFAVNIFPTSIPDGVASYAIFANNNPGSLANYIQLSVSGGAYKLNLAFNNGASNFQCTTTGTFAFSRMQYIVAGEPATLSASSTFIYVNGTAQGYSGGSCTTATGTSAFHPTNVLLGSNGGGTRGFAGQIDDARIYGAALVAGQATALNSATTPTTLINGVETYGTVNGITNNILCGIIPVSGGGAQTCSGTSDGGDNVYFGPDSINGAAVDTRWLDVLANCTFTPTSGSNTYNCNYYKQLNNTYTATPTQPFSWVNSVKINVTGNYLGVFGQVATITTAAGGGLASAIGWVDVGTFNFTHSIIESTLTRTATAPYIFTETSPGTFNVDYVGGLPTTVGAESYLWLLTLPLILLAFIAAKKRR